MGLFCPFWPNLSVRTLGFYPWSVQTRSYSVWRHGTTTTSDWIGLSRIDAGLERFPFMSRFLVPTRTVTLLTSPSSLLLTAVTMASGHSIRGVLRSDTNTTSAMARFRWGVSQFCLAVRLRTCCFFQRLQNCSMRYFIWHHLLRANMSSLTNVPGGGMGWDVFKVQTLEFKHYSSWWSIRLDGYDIFIFSVVGWSWAVFFRGHWLESCLGGLGLSHHLVLCILISHQGLWFRCGVGFRIEGTNPLCMTGSTCIVDGLCIGGE